MEVYALLLVLFDATFPADIPEARLNNEIKK